MAKITGVRDPQLFCKLEHSETLSYDHEGHPPLQTGGPFHGRALTSRCLRHFLLWLSLLSLPWEPAKEVGAPCRQRRASPSSRPRATARDAEVGSCAEPAAHTHSPVGKNTSSCGKAPVGSKVRTTHLRGRRRAGGRQVTLQFQLGGGTPCSVG